jgi:hypothetical protein
MNIFVTDSCPVRSAEYLDDKRVIKMVLETTQILCTALNHYGEDVPYKPTHVNHPSNVWARYSRENWLWLWQHGKALSREYTNRYGKVHKCDSILDDLYLKQDVIPSKTLTKHSNNAKRSDMGVDYTNINDVFLAYRLYLDDRWATDKRPPTWHKQVRS